MSPGRKTSSDTLTKGASVRLRKTNDAVAPEKKTTYCFSLGIMERCGLHVSWLVDAADPEEAVRLSKESFAATCDGDPLEFDGFRIRALHAGVMHVDPEWVTGALIIDEHEA